MDSTHWAPDLVAQHCSYSPGWAYIGSRSVVKIGFRVRVRVRVRVGAGWAERLNVVDVAHSGAGSGQKSRVKGQGPRQGGSQSKN